MKYLLSGVLADSISWQAPFYVYGLLGLLWFALWTWLSSEKPSTHGSISEREKSHIEESLGDSHAETVTLCNLPCGKLLTSLPLHSVVIANFAHGWTSYLLMATQAKYFHEVFSSRLGIWQSILPHLVMAMAVPLSGLVADILRMRTSSTTTRVRKIFTCVGLGGEIIFLMLAGQVNNQTLASAALTLAVASGALSRCNVNVNLLDIAPRHAAILAGLCNTVATFAAMSCPRFLEKLNSLLDMLGWRGDDCHSMYFCRSSWQKVTQKRPYICHIFYCAGLPDGRLLRPDRLDRLCDLCKRRDSGLGDSSTSGL